MEAAISRALEARIDFEGQKVTDTIVRYVLISATIVSFIIGFAAQSLFLSCVVLGGSTGVLALVVIPPWPAYNKHPLTWLPKIEEKKTK